MTYNFTRLCAIALIIIACAPSLIFTELTTLMHYDPAPIFSANDSMMPPNSQFLDLTQARFKKETPNKKRYFGINISGFIQGANSAVNSNGVQYGTVVGIPQNGFEMGDFRGTLYAMGIFLGANPETGDNIWANGIDNGEVANITPTSINNFLTPSKYACLNEAAQNLAGWVDPGSQNNALVFYDAGASPADVTAPSIFSDINLALDNTYFGSFSLPISYRKQGMRFELNLQCNDYIGFTMQGGFANIKQTYTNTIASQNTTASSCSAIGQTAYGPYSISNVVTICNVTGSTAQTVSPLYNQLNSANNPVESPNTSAQEIFNTWLSDNLYSLLSPTCGINQSLCTFDDYSAEDLRFYMTLQYPFDPKHFNQKDEEHEDEWPDMIFTPYIWGGATAPVAKCTDYNQLLSLAFGNNGHVSAGGGLGMTFDFAESVEIGFEGGATYFFQKNECRPFPTHPLQRVVYPFRTEVTTQPGLNWNFKALLNAYQFLKHVSFWFTYEIVEHRTDCYTVCNTDQAQYFYPDVLTCNSDWKAQFFNAALVFDFQPGIQASLAWQQPISPKNAYYPVSIVGSLNFMF